MDITTFGKYKLQIAKECEESIELCVNGDIKINGKLAVNDIEVVTGMREMLSSFNKDTVPLDKAIMTLVKHLKEDKGYYEGWQANIAMSFYDEYSRYMVDGIGDLSTICNKAAKYFLDNLIG